MVFGLYVVGCREVEQGLVNEGGALPWHGGRDSAWVARREIAAEQAPKQESCLNREERGSLCNRELRRRKSSAEEYVVVLLRGQEDSRCYGSARTGKNLMYY
jgi:hypothetical protein